MAQDNVHHRDVTSCYVLFMPTFVKLPVHAATTSEFIQIEFFDLKRKPARCQPTTVLDLTICNGPRFSPA